VQYKSITRDRYDIAAINHKFIITLFFRVLNISLLLPSAQGELIAGLTGHFRFMAQLSKYDYERKTKENGS
jgi:hypothetical protein